MDEPQSEGGPITPRQKSLGFRVGMWIAVVGVFAVQVGLIFWLGNPPPLAPLKLPEAPVIQMSGSGSEEMLTLLDPTLFVLPHRDNFSGDAWLKITPQTFESTNWTEPPRPLPLRTEQLGSAFVAFMQTNQPPRYQLALASGFDSGSGDVPPLGPISTSSVLRVEGDLARLRLLTPLHLPPQTNSELLANTVIQLLVNAQGYPFSPAISSSSGSTEVDALALTNYARAVRFAPAQEAALGTVPANPVTVGRLVFEWQTVPPAPTNSTSATP